MKKILVPILFFTSFSLAEGIYPIPSRINIFNDSVFIESSSFLSLKDKGKILVFLPEKPLNQVYFSFSSDLCIPISIEKAKDIKSKNIENLKKLLKEKEFKLDILLKKEQLLDKIPVKLSTVDKISKRYTKISKDIKKLKEEIKNISDKLYILKLKEGNPAYVYYQCKGQSKERISILYPANISAIQSYVIRASLSEGSIEIGDILTVRNFEPVSYKDVSLLYYRYSKTQEVTPESKGRVFYMNKSIMLHRKRPPYREKGSKFFFLLKNINIPAESTKTVYMSLNRYKADFDIYVDGTERPIIPFLRASFIPDRYFYRSDNASFFVDNIYLGKATFNSLEKGKKSSLFFGEDPFLDVKKEKVYDFSKRGFLGKITHTVKWRYTIKNNHISDVTVTISDELPVYSSKEHRVEYFSDIKWDKLKNDGTVIWKLHIKPQEEILFIFGYKETYRSK